MRNTTLPRTAIAARLCGTGAANLAKASCGPRPLVWLGWVLTWRYRLPVLGEAGGDCFTGRGEILTRWHRLRRGGDFRCRRRFGPRPMARRAQRASYAQFSTISRPASVRGCALHVLPRLSSGTTPQTTRPGWGSSDSSGDRPAGGGRRGRRHPASQHGADWPEIPDDVVGGHIAVRRGQELAE